MRKIQNLLRILKGFLLISFYSIPIYLSYKKYKKLRARRSYRLAAKFGLDIATIYQSSGPQNFREYISLAIIASSRV